jgi:hypothetical protein
MGFSSFLGGDEAGFDSYDEFVPEHVPEPGASLEDASVLTGREHVAVHRLARRLFEERGVYDVTFGYNLARLNLDVRHPDAGFRYAEESESTLLAEFTPTTEFCPQSETLTLGAFRAFNGETDRHEYDLVRVRVDTMQHEAASINRKLAGMEQTYAETGRLRRDVTADGSDGEVPTERGPPPSTPF